MDWKWRTKREGPEIEELELKGRNWRKQEAHRNKPPGQMCNNSVFWPGQMCNTQYFEEKINVYIYVIYWRFVTLRNLTEDIKFFVFLNGGSDWMFVKFLGFKCNSRNWELDWYKLILTSCMRKERLGLQMARVQALGRKALELISSEGPKWCRLRRHVMVMLLPPTIFSIFARCSRHFSKNFKPATWNNLLGLHRSYYMHNRIKF